MSSADTPNAVTLKDFPKICRTCLGEEKLGPIKGTFVCDINIEDLLEYSVMIQVNEDDYLPQNICEKCLVQLYKTYEFKKLCRNNENILKSLVQISVLDEPIKATEEFPNTFVEKNEYEIEENNCNQVKIKPKATPECYKCKDCHYIASSKEERLEHCKKAQHGEFKKNKCQKVQSDIIEQSEIKKEFSDISLMEENNCSSTEENNCVEVKNKPFRNRPGRYNKCEDCDFTSPFKKERLEHRRKAGHGQFRIYTCEICNKPVIKRKMRQHMRLHTEGKPYECDICYQRFTESGNLKRHKLIHTGERPHVCSFCGKGFIQLVCLQAHEKVHKKQQILDPECLVKMKFNCNICGRSFRRASSFKMHLDKHANPDQPKDQSEKEQEARDYLCDICACAFKTKLALKRHQTSHGEKSFLCSVCGKGFMSKGGLLVHLKAHAGVKPHTCVECKKSFTQWGGLNSHMLIHKGFKPYSCKHCPKTFNQSSHLTAHLRTHSGEKPYKCSFCNKTFALKGNLTTPIRIHTGDTPHVCSVCGKGFCNTTSLKRHRQLHSKREQLDSEEAEHLV